MDRYVGTTLVSLAVAAFALSWLRYVGERRRAGPKGPPAGAPPDGDPLIAALLGAVPILAGLALLVRGPTVAHVERLVSVPVGPASAALGVALYVDALSLFVLVVVGTLSVVVYRFSARYLTGERRRARFLGWLTFTLAAVQLLVLSGNLALLAVSWVAVSVGLRRLLLHYGERPQAVVAARKKLLVSRAGDVSLAVGLVVLLSRFGTLDLRDLFAMVQGTLTGEQKAGLELAGYAMVFAVVCKSAQVPFHAWLPETLEAPTPVSALMHAGVINGGGYLVMRTSPLLAQAPAALTMLTVFGTVTAVLGTLVFWTQTDVKRALAWSTVSQMGFMLVQCGVGAFAASLVHLAGHSFYKANAFLRSGTLPAPGVSRPASPPSPARALLRFALGTALAAAVLAGSFWALGRDPLHGPGGWMLPLVAVLALGQLAGASGTSPWVGGALVVLVTGLASVLTVTSEHVFSASVAWAPALSERGLAGAVIAAVVALAWVTLALLSVFLPWLPQHGWGLALYAHSRNGFYLGALTDRFVRRVASVRPLSPTP